MFSDILKIPKKEIAEGINARFLHTNHNTLAYVELEKGALLPLHAHVHEQTTQVIEGKLELIIDGEKHLIEKNMVVNIPSNVEHSARAITKCIVTDVFYPVREDYK